MIHQPADRSTLALLRIWVFGIWFVHLLFDPLEELARLPRDLFRPPGFLRIVPRDLWDHLLEDHVLLGFRIVLLVLLLLVALGTFRRVYVPLVTAGLIVVYQGVVRGFSGHMNHGEIMLMVTTVVMAFFPMSEVLSIRRPAPDDPRVNEAARAAVIAVTVLFAASYFFVGVVRLSKGIDLFGSDSLRNNVANHWIDSGGIHGGGFRLPGDTPVFELLPGWLFKALYVGATLLEVAVPLVLVSRMARLAIPPALLVFHVMNIQWLGIAFIHDMLMLVLFSDVWLSRLGRTLAEVEDSARRARAPAESVG